MEYEASGNLSYEVIESKVMPMIYTIKINWSPEDKQEMIDIIEIDY
jgi:hypothetical protein